ncbi:MAG TPA: phosphoethanolamine--lipid A transferase [Gammaproteobacteria bacterium]|nr:phosphoethanolamine--lipid A transferase [Gammaproteobacteria bacterium]
MTTSEAAATPASLPHPPLTRFWAPRYWSTWLLLSWLRLTAALPWRLALAVHRSLGRALWYLLPSRRWVVLRNLAICFPELDGAARKRLARRHFESLAMSLAEIAIAWFAKSLPPVRIEGLGHLEAALAKGHGAVLYSGHFTTLELTAQFIKPLVPRFAFMFRTRSNPLLDAAQARGRERAGHFSFRNSDSRAMLRALRANAAVWYAPDQAFDGSGAELLPFFGEPAMTNTATTRIARISGAPVLPLSFRRCDDGSGYVLRIEPPVVALPTDDVRADTQKLTAILERFVRECPDQYFWTHRRFRGRGATLPDPYARQPPAGAPGRRRWRDMLGAPGLAAAVALFIVAADNDPFWQTAWRATAHDEHRLAILWSLFAIVFFTLAGLLLLAMGRKLLKTLAVTLLLIAASCGYFMSQYGVVIDQAMIRNTAETTVLEATPLLGAAYFWHLVLYGVVPAVVVVFAPLKHVAWHVDAVTRLGAAAAGIGVLVASLYANFAAVSFFGHQNHTLRLLINPSYPIYAAAAFGIASRDDTPTAREPLDVRLATGPARKPALVVLVMGETARADRFSLNGYARDTNRYTRPLDVVNFPHVVSCGTSTADSVPCLFSALGQAGFTHAAAAHQEPLFAALQRLGVNTFWRDNSTGCKEVCDEQHFEERANWTHPELCDSTGCFDEILLEDFDDLIADSSRDHFIVLHQRGSHGPAYHTDAPQWAKDFLPECNLPNLRNCNLDAINNSYDNTILYTDYFLSRVIEELDKRSRDFDTAMLYVSDHGESLGENGLYLHGLPYSMAPREQTQVPMLLWASPGFYSTRAHVDRACLRRSARRPTTHDAIFHTLLPLFGVASRLYDPSLDLLRECRGHKLTAHDAY